MSLELNNIIISVKQLEKDLIELYHMESLGQKRQATNAALDINKRLLEAAALFSQHAVEILEEDTKSKPKLRLV